MNHDKNQKKNIAALILRVDSSMGAAVFGAAVAAMMVTIVVLAGLMAVTLSQETECLKGGEWWRQVMVVVVVLGRYNYQPSWFG